jgi:mannose-6-phosphate isomerase-like protein (cupin superfamily)
VSLQVGRVDPAALIAEPGNQLELSPLLAASDTDGALSATWVRINGRHRRLRTPASTRLYAVLSGALIVECDDDPPVRLSAGEVAAISPGAAYGLRGIATYLVINTPGFTDGDDQYLD